MNLLLCSSEMKEPCLPFQKSTHTKARVSIYLSWISIFLLLKWSIRYESGIILIIGSIHYWRIQPKPWRNITCKWTNLWVLLKSHQWNMYKVISSSIFFFFLYKWLTYFFLMHNTQFPWVLKFYLAFLHSCTVLSS